MGWVPPTVMHRPTEPNQIVKNRMDEPVGLAKLRALADPAPDRLDATLEPPVTYPAAACAGACSKAMVT